MESLNRIIFLILGLVAVIIFFAVLTGRINLKGKLPTFSDGAKKENLTPTPTSVQSNISNTETKKTDTASENKPYKTTDSTTTAQKKLTSIPATGLPTLLWPVSLSFFGIGFYLARRK